MTSGDEWCFVESETGSSRSPSYDECEPEQEPLASDEDALSYVNKTTQCASTEQDEHVQALLPDTPAYLSLSLTQRREFALSLLSPSHRRYAITGLADASCTRKRSVRVAFAAPSHRVYADSTFSQRLRAAMPSRQATFVDAATDTSTEVKPFTREQSTQTSFDPADECDTDRLDRLKSALERSLRLSMQVKATAHEAERRDVARMRLQAQLESSELKYDAQSKQLQRVERGLKIARHRSALAEEYQKFLKREVETLRTEQSVLLQRVEVLAGGLDVDAKSIDELEQLEDALDAAAAKVRTALRTKYCTAMRPQATCNAPTKDELCVVCLTRVVSVRLEPCRHEVLCSHCALRVSSCPVDRAEICDKVLTHGLNAYKHD